jgi:hypothetical protein
MFVLGTLSDAKIATATGYTTMSPSSGKSKRRKRGKPPRRFSPRPPAESRGAEAITVAWTVSLTAVLLCNLMAVAAHVLSTLIPVAGQLQLVENLVLLSGALIGLVSLLLVPVVYRLRRTAPPPGFVMFGVLISLAPLVVVIGQFMWR